MTATAAKIQDLQKRETEIQDTIDGLGAVIRQKTANGEDVSTLRSIVSELESLSGRMLNEIVDLQQAEFSDEAGAIAERLISGDQNAVDAIAGILTAYNRWCAVETQEVTS